MLSVGISGPNRTNEGTGEFVTNCLHQHGASIAAVAVRSPKAGDAATKRIASLVGREPKCYSNLEDLIAVERPNAIAICTPSIMHEHDLRTCLYNNIHVFCEKPLIWKEENLYESVLELVNEFESRNLVLHHNTQWLYALPSILEITQAPLSEKLNSVTLEFASKLFDPAFILRETIPHANSIVIGLGLTDSWSDFAVSINPANKILHAKYIHTSVGGHRTEIDYVISVKEAQPRPMAIILNNMRIERRLNMNGYKTYLAFNNKVKLIEDPLNRSVSSFIRKMEANTQNMHDGSSASTLQNFWLLCKFKDLFKSITIEHYSANP